MTPEVMPKLSRMAEQSTNFRRAYSNAPWTIPSVASVFTGVYPSYHGLNSEGHLVALEGNRIRTDIPTLAEMLADHGFSIAAFVTHGPLAPQLGFHRGFDRYEEIKRRNGHDIEQISERVRTFLETAQQPFFLYLHTFEAHLPDTGGSYREDLRYLDERLDRVFGLLQGQPTILIVFSDHGKDVSRPKHRHGFDLTDELLHVPLVINGPGVHPLQVDEPVQLIDLKQTIADLAGLDRSLPGTGQGRSLVPILQGESLQPVPIIAEAPFQGPGWIRIAWADFTLVFRPDHQSSDNWWWKEPRKPEREFQRHPLRPRPSSRLESLGH